MARERIKHMLSGLLSRIAARLIYIYQKIFYYIYIIFNQPNAGNLYRKDAEQQARLYLLSRSLKKCGERLFVDFPISIHNANQVEIGDDVALGAYVLIWGGAGVRIASRAMIATHVVISSQSHDAHAEQPRWTSLDLPVNIEEDVWIGAGSIILPGITIGKGAIVGAGSVVTHDVSPGSIVVGSPARQVRKKN